MTEMEANQPGKPVASLVLGIIGLLAWFIPLIGLSVIIPGLVFGIKALKRRENGMAIAGVVLCSIGLLLCTINFVWGAYLGVTGQHPLLNGN